MFGVLGKEECGRIFSSAMGRDSAALNREKSCRTLKTGRRDFAKCNFSLSAPPENFCTVARLYPHILSIRALLPSKSPRDHEDRRRRCMNGLTRMDTSGLHTFIGTGIAPLLCRRARRKNKIDTHTIVSAPTAN